MSKCSSIVVAWVLSAAVWMPVAFGEGAVDERTNAWRNLIGSWEVTSAQTSLILSIEPEHEVLVLWIRPGSHSMMRTSWSAMAGGILVRGVPRMRLWGGRDGRYDELRAEIEALPELGVEPDKLFHDHFFMRRIKHLDVPQALLDRPLPTRWQMTVPDNEWNETAGRQPLPENRAQAEQDESTVPVKATPSASSAVR